ncbi:hypothetical protein UFOVP380_2 [uncultured Caudovirales phage]|uniref:Uncharacterized protein n=1 Tax=uncultured Caudovirales phage TaxID=2100421 RepID=A0A6J7X4G8_9CAUD|nr:hypothetical protein UFOVP380_2 [uncultured Caudovirales phage]
MDEEWYMDALRDDAEADAQVWLMDFSHEEREEDAEPNEQRHN